MLEMKGRSKISSPPFGICPLNSLHHSDLPVHSVPDVEQVIDIFQKFAVDLARQDGHGTLPEKVNLTEQESVVLVGKHPIRGGGRIGQHSINVSVQGSVCTVERRVKFTSGS